MQRTGVPFRYCTVSSGCVDNDSLAESVSEIHAGRIRTYERRTRIAYRPALGVHPPPGRRGPGAVRPGPDRLRRLRRPVAGPAAAPRQHGADLRALQHPAARPVQRRHAGLDVGVAGGRVPRRRGPDGRLPVLRRRQPAAPSQPFLGVRRRPGLPRRRRRSWSCSCCRPCRNSRAAPSGGSSRPPAWPSAGSTSAGCTSATATASGRCGRRCSACSAPSSSPCSAFFFMLPAVRDYKDSYSRSKVLVLFDVSGSMAGTIDDIPTDAVPLEKLLSRQDKVIQFLNDEKANFVKRLEEKNPVDVYRFARGLDPEYLHFSQEDQQLPAVRVGRLAARPQPRQGADAAAGPLAAGILEGVPQADRRRRTAGRVDRRRAGALPQVPRPQRRPDAEGRRLLQQHQRRRLGAVAAR